MRIVLVVFAVVSVLLGGLSFAIARSDIQLILAAVFIGFAVVFVGLAVVISEVLAVRAALRYEAESKASDTAYAPRARH